MQASATAGLPSFRVRMPGTRRLSNRDVSNASWDCSHNNAAAWCTCLLLLLLADPVQRCTAAKDARQEDVKVVSFLQVY